MFLLVLFLLVTFIAGEENRDFYKILQIPRSADAKEIKTAYRTLVKKWHPDLNPDKSEKAQAKFIDLQNAYEVLSEPDKKKLYDRCGEKCVREGEQGGSSHRSGPGSGPFRHGPFTHGGNPFMRTNQNTIHFASNIKRFKEFSNLIAGLSGGENRADKHIPGWPTLLLTWGSGNFQNVQKLVSIINSVAQSLDVGDLVTSAAVECARYPETKPYCNKASLLVVTFDTNNKLKVLESIKFKEGAKAQEYLKQIQKHIPNNFKDITTRDQFIEYVKAESSGPKLIFINKREKLGAQLKKYAFNYPHADYASLDPRFAKVLSREGLLPPNISIPQGTSKWALHIYNTQMEKYTEMDQGIELIEFQAPVTDTFHSTVKPLVTAKMNKKGVYGGKSTVYTLTDANQETVCSSNESRTCVIELIAPGTNNPSGGLSEVAKLYQNESGFVFGKLHLNNDILNIFDDERIDSIFREGGDLPSYLFIRPKRKLYRVFTKETNIGGVLKDILDNDKMTRMSDGISKLPKDKIFDVSKKYTRSSPDSSEL